MKDKKVSSAAFKEVFLGNAGAELNGSESQIPAFRARHNAKKKKELTESNEDVSFDDQVDQADDVVHVAALSGADHRSEIMVAENTNTDAGGELEEGLLRDKDGAAAAAGLFRQIYSSRDFRRCVLSRHSIRHGFEMMDKQIKSIVY